MLHHSLYVGIRIGCRRAIFKLCGLDEQRGNLDAQAVVFFFIVIVEL